MQNNVEDVPPPAVPPPDEVPIPMVVPSQTGRSLHTHCRMGQPQTRSHSKGILKLERKPVEEEVEFVVPRAASLRRAFASLDEVDPCAQFQQRAAVMWSVPKFLVGMFRNALKIALKRL